MSKLNEVPNLEHIRAIADEASLKQEAVVDAHFKTVLDRQRLELSSRVREAASKGRYEVDMTVENSPENLRQLILPYREQGYKVTLVHIEGSKKYACYSVVISWEQSS